MLSIDDLGVSFRYRKGPSPLPAEYRPLWRVALVLLMLKINGRGGKLGFKHLQALDWAIRAPVNAKSISRFIKENIEPDSSIIGVDPSLNKAINYSSSLGLVEVVAVNGGARVQVTQNGLKFVEKIIEDKFLEDESQVLGMIGKRLTMSVIDKLLR